MTVEIVKGMRISPLGGYAAQLASLPAGIQVREVPFLTQLDLRVDSATPEAAAAARVLGRDLPTEPCTAVETVEGLHVLWLGPDEWLVVAPPDQAQLEAALAEAVGPAGAVVDVSAHRTTVSVSGRRARDLLAHGCAIDLDPRVSPKGTCVQTLLALAGVTIVVRDDQGTDFTLLVRSSFARYLAEWIIDACVEYRDDPSWR